MDANDIELPVRSKNNIYHDYKFARIKNTKKDLTLERANQQLNKYWPNK